MTEPYKIIEVKESVFAARPHAFARSSSRTERFC